MLVSVVIAIVATLVSVALISRVAQRVLGVRVGVVRATLAALVALGAELGFESRVVWKQSVDRLAFLPQQIGVILLVALLFLVVAEIVIPRGSIARPDQMMRAARLRTQQARRGFQLSRVAVRHGIPGLARTGPNAGTPQERIEQAAALRGALEEAGVTFVKLGQILSTRQDLLPQEYIDELSHLQQRVGPVPWPEIAAVLAEELKGDPDKVFAAIDREPLAAASIAQVHRARLHTGEEVVLKVQRPGIGPVVERDLGIALSLARRLESNTVWGRSIGIGELTEGFAQALREELDFRIETRNMAALRATIFQHDTTPSIVVPKPYLDYSTERVLVMDFVPGKTLSSPDAVEGRSAAERNRIAAVLFESLLRQVMVDGVFHADPHPGNIVLLDDGGVALIDLGSVGRIDSELRANLGQFLMAVDRGNPELVCDALLSFVVRPEFVDEDGLRRGIGRFIALHMTPGTSADITVFTDLVRLVAEYDLTVPGEVAGAFRAIGTLEGTLAAVAPDFDIVAQSREFANRQFTERLRPESLQAAVTDELLAVLPLLRRIPRHVDRIASSLEAGRVTVNVSLFADHRDRTVVTGLVNQVLLAFLGGIVGIMGVVLLANPGGARVTDTLTLHEMFGYNLILVSAVLVLRVLYVVFSARHE